MGLQVTDLRDRLRDAGPGLLLAATIALAVRFVSDQLGGPAMLYALLFGMAFNFLTEDERFARGIYIASRNILRIGVALLGLRITTTEVMDLGWPVVGLIVVSVVVTILAGGLVGRAFGLKGDQSVLSAGAVAICGASAALAISSVLPTHKDHERNTIITVAGVTALSTAAMVIYPVFATYLQYDNATAGVFLGATIHDVAQVVGAGYIISDQTGEISTLVKLIRVACLVPVVITISLITHRSRAESPDRRPLLPWFLIAFVVLVIVNSMGWVPSTAQSVLTPFSSWCLLTAVAALGVKTSLKALADVGPAPVGVMVIQTLLLAALVIGGVALIR
ncbi:MAG: putative sulfate exporter family transporter [Woeseiaceae bacterium]|nr:putative sulfate exporter family transporter [Woeseiaceae bacterium]NIP19786.1 putative sulfate exporter family transporter [Woeseiaceae bacterium]NIS89903.1 putative sulfate exporter family transporter [Woeseiaceae bacterium]